MDTNFYWQIHIVLTYNHMPLLSKTVGTQYKD